MPRRKQDQAVAKRAHQILAEKAQRRKRRDGEEAVTKAPEQPKPKRTSRAKPERKERKPRVHADLLTVAFRGPLAGKFRELAAGYQMSLTRLLQDALLAYERNVAAGYQPGSALAEWQAQQGGGA
jgi:hypothetical protein